MSYLGQLLTEIARFDHTDAPPRAYGAFHLSFTLIGFAICVLLAYFLRRLGDKAHRRLLFSCGAFLAVTEVYKQLFYYYCMGGDVGYEWWIFPFQLCSIPMYFCMIAPFLPKGAVQRAMYNFMVTYNLLGGFIAFFEPSGLIHEHWTLTLHAFVWHMLLVFIGFYLAASGRAGGDMRDFRSSFFVYLCLCAIAFIINLSLRRVSGGSVNMFYIGPSNSPLIVFKTISQRLGWYVNTLLYIPCVTLGAFIFFLPQYLIQRRKKSAA